MADRRKEAIKTYVEGTCAEFIKANRDFRNVEYRYGGYTENSYLKMTTAFGYAKYFDVTGLDAEGICKLICVVASGVSVRLELKDLEIIREVERLFV